MGLDVDGFLLNYTTATVWSRGSDGQLHITDLANSGFEDGDEVVIMLRKDFETLKGAINQ